MLLAQLVEKLKVVHNIPKGENEMSRIGKKPIDIPKKTIITLIWAIKPQKVF